AERSANSASLAEGNSRSVSEMRLVAMADATSPPACPPMPSATRKRYLPAYPLSWLLDRIFPTWETAALVPVAIHLPPKFEARHADLHRSAQRHRSWGRHSSSVEECAVSGVQVLDHPAFVPLEQPGVMRRGVVVTDDESRFVRAPDCEL